MTMILLILLWILLLIHSTGAFLTLCNAVRYKDMAVHLDAERIGHQPFQPRISLVTRCDFRTNAECISKIQGNLSLNYTQYEVILLVDSSGNEEDFAEILTYFEMKQIPETDAVRELRYPVRACYRSCSASYKRLTVVDKSYHPKDDLRDTGLAISKGGYMLFIPSLDDELIRNSLANLAIMKMRNSKEHITPIRGVARYNCSGSFLGSFFRMMADICNLRRIYIVGGLKGVDYGKFVVLRDVSEKKGKEEFVPKPQMFLHRPNTFNTYLEQLAPHNFYTSYRGKLVSFMEFLITGIFWGAGIHVIVTPGVVNEDFLFLLAVFLLPLIASTFSIFIGEIFLKQNYKIRFVLRLIAVSVFESVVFCLLQPWMWIRNLCIKTCRSLRIS